MNQNESNARTGQLQVTAVDLSRTQMVEDAASRHPSTTGPVQGDILRIRSEIGFWISGVGVRA